MTSHQKLIDYYFCHFTEFDFEAFRELTALQLEVCPPKYAKASQKPWKQVQADSIAILMGQVIHNTYRHFFGVHRDILKYRYFQKNSRLEICRKLKISTRTYHRYLLAMLNFAEELANKLRIEQQEYHKQVNFFAAASLQNSFNAASLQNTFNQEYFSDSTQI